jgi:very-short-patch-repair endonuclease
VPSNALESDVYDTLEAAGLKLIAQMGASQFRIDFVVQHPAKPGRYVLAIELDGATYHSSYTARDRDRLRQQQLENLGWRFHRIWSTDWFMRREEEIQRAIKAYWEAVDFADRLDQGSAPNNHQENENSREHASAAPAYLRRVPRPAIPVRSSITQYTSTELVQLLRWIASDGQLRTDDQILDEMVAVLGFSRRGVRIERAIQSAITLWRQRA